MSRLRQAVVLARGHSPAMLGAASRRAAPGATESRTKAAGDRKASFAAEIMEQAVPEMSCSSSRPSASVRLRSPLRRGVTDAADRGPERASPLVPRKKALARSERRPCHGDGFAAPQEPLGAGFRPRWQQLGSWKQTFRLPCAGKDLDGDVDRQSSLTDQSSAPWSIPSLRVSFCSFDLLLQGESPC